MIGGEVTPRPLQISACSSLLSEEATKNGENLSVEWTQQAGRRDIPLRPTAGCPSRAAR